LDKPTRQGTQVIPFPHFFFGHSDLLNLMLFFLSGE
jgi:hypothetical protein